VSRDIGLNHFLAKDVSKSEKSPSILILLQQALPPGAYSSVKLSPVAGNVASSSSASISATESAVAGAAAMSFDHPNFPGNEAQSLAILLNPCTCWGHNSL
ncbi:hypothetical protein OIU85_028858, partial [Salix viminalis]